MSDAPQISAPESIFLKFARGVVNNRVPVAIALVLSTSFFFYPILNAATTAFGYALPGPVVRVDTEARAQWPDHPFIRAQDKFANKFGGSAMVAAAVVVKEGTIFTPETMQKIHRITQRLDGWGYDSHTNEREELRYQLEEGYGDDEEIDSAKIQKQLDIRYPPYPVNHYQDRSVTHNSTRVI